MPGSPTRTDVHVNAPLTQISNAYLQNQDSFVAGKVFSSIKVDKRSDLFYTYSKADFMRDEVKERAPGAESALANFGLSTSPYLCKVFSLGMDLDAQTLANQDAALNLESDTARFLTQKLMISKEKQWIDAYFGASKWSGVADGTGWNWSSASSSPIDDVQTKADLLHSATGYFPNTLILGQGSYRLLANHANVIDRIKYTQTGTVTEDILGSLLGVPRIFVLRGIENSAKEGQAASMALLGNSYSALLCYSAPSPGLMTPSGGYEFQWNTYEGSGGQSISRFEMPHRKSTRIEIEAAYDYQIIGADLGAFESGINS